MAEYKYVDANPSIEEVEKSVLVNGGVLNSFDGGFVCPGRVLSQYVGDWEIVLVDRMGMKNHGSFIAVATTQETFRTQKRATISVLRQQADEAEARGTKSFRERGDIACQVVPLLQSKMFWKGRERYFLFADNKWAYFAIPHANRIRFEDGRHRLWVRPARKQDI